MDELSDNSANTPEENSEDKVEGGTVNHEEALTDSSKPVVGQGKFEGKDMSEVVKAYDELEKKLGKQSEEMGMLRHSFDEGVLALLKQQQQIKPDPYLNEEELAETLLQNPRKVISEMRKQITDEVMDEVKNISAVNKAEMSLLKRHADKDEILKGRDFQNWVIANVPPELAKMSDSQEANGNPEILGFLLDSYKKTTGKKPGSGNGVSAAKMAAPVPGMSSNPSGVRILTRTELAKMSPDEYARRNDEILAAYKSGRVK